MDSSSDLSKLDVKMEYCEDAAKAKTDSDCWTEFTPEKPPMKKKTPNPTIMYSLPAQKEFAFTFMHKGSKEAKISIGVNHQ